MKRLYNIINGKELKEQIQNTIEERTTISFYKYHLLSNTSFFRDFLYHHLDILGVLGRIYVAEEGINGQISIPTHRLSDLRDFFDDIIFLKNIRFNQAIEDTGKSFFKLKITLRNKIVADGITDPSFNPTVIGKHINAEEFNKLVEQPETILIDMRNHYESEVGHFKDAICPDVVTFRESLPIVADQFETQKSKNIVMYCTGGIRCEKASAYMKYKGFENVFQLNGGIIEYVREVKSKGLENKFLGKNFVFDERLGEKVSNDIIANCHQCGTSCDTHNNCANDACHILFIQCDQCAIKYNKCCSTDCAEFNTLDEQEKKVLRKIKTFNGTKFSKGRYKSFSHQNDILI